MINDITEGQSGFKYKPSPLEIHEESSAGPKTPSTPKALGFTNTFERKRAEKERKIGHRRVDEQGQVTYKKIETSTICGSIQLGIGYAVGSLASKPERDLLMQDFAMVETTFFPKEGSNITPAHYHTDFKFKAYAPVAFRYFRDLFGIAPDDFLLSVCNEPMRELSNAGASGSVFYLTNDDEFIIKTVQHKEAEFLTKLLPGYYMNLNQNPRTLLPKFFGLYCYLCGGKNVRICVMNNLLPSYVKMHQKYDLKGSTYKRKASKYEKSKKSPTYKDLDFIEHHPEGISLEAETYNALIKTMQRDCRVLESFKIMDYSLLVGIHNLDQAAREKQEQIKEKMAALAEEAALAAKGKGLEDLVEGQESGDSGDKLNVTKGNTGLTRSRSITNRQRLAAYSTAMESIQAEVEPIDEEEDVPTGGIPARNAKGERLLLFLGIIDILQSYRLKKKLEHSIKAMVIDGDTISVHRPSFYAHRFQDFMGKIVFKKIPSPLKHSPSKRKGMLARMRPPSTSEPTDSKQQQIDSGNNKVGTGIKSSSTTNEGQEAISKMNITNSPSTGPAPPLPSNASLISQQGDPIGYSSFKQKPVDTVPCLRTVVIKQAASKQCVHHPSSSEKSDGGISISQIPINFNADSTSSVTSSSSANSSGLGSTLRTITWTPPHSVIGSTPTHTDYTEGTPSLTESSESGDLDCPTTPARSISRKSQVSCQYSDSVGGSDNITENYEIK